MENGKRGWNKMKEKEKAKKIRGVRGVRLGERFGGLAPKSRQSLAGNAIALNYLCAAGWAVVRLGRAMGACHSDLRICLAGAETDEDVLVKVTSE